MRYTLEKSTLLLTGILVVVILTMTTVTVIQLYRLSFEQQRQRLVVAARSQAQLIEAVARFDRQHYTGAEGLSEAATLSQIREAHENFRGFGETGEFTLAKLENQTIHFLLQQRYQPKPSDIKPPDNIEMGSRFAEPMQLALSGRSGTIVARDYHGATVLAAYEPIPTLGYGIVVKIDLAEIRAPFIEAGVISLLLGGLLTGVGALAFRRITNPLINRIRGGEERLRLLLNSTGEGIYGIDTSGHCTFVNAACLKLLGYESADELLGRELHSVIHHHYPDGRAYPEDQCHIFKAFRQGQGTHIDSEVLWRKDGTPIPVEYLSFPIFEGSDCTGAVITFMDISQRIQQQEEQRLSASVFDNISEGILVTDANASIIAINRAFTGLTGYSEEDALGKNPRFLKSGKHDQEFYDELWQDLLEKGYWQGEIWNRRKSGEVFPEWQTISSVKDEQGRVTHYVAAFSDISTLKEAEDRLQHLAHHDPLTGLANRLLLNARLDLSLQRAARQKSSVAVIFMDLDGFKEINDEYGHEIGDKVLQETGHRLDSMIRQEDTVCRLGGDEFILVIADVHKREDVAAFAEKVLKIVRQEIAIDRHRLSVSGSLGISIHPEHGQQASTLLRNADTAMYQAKKQGRNRYRFYQPEQ
jgi:diguanylate cyclase (GGDEF)-like protein/PAS domain S-box-containing protein